MSIFSSIVATIAQDLDQILKERILKLCAEDDQLIILRKQSQDDIAIQGQLKSICDLEAKCQILTSPIDDIEENKSKSNDSEFKIVQKRKLNRDENLPDLKCILCSFKTKRPNHLSNHLTKHTPNEKLKQCHQCPFTCIRDIELTKHIKQKHSSDFVEQIYFECESCGKIYKFKSHLLEHQIKEHDHDAENNHNQPVKFYHCNICSYKTLKHSFLTRHLTKHQKKVPKKEKMMKCLNCNYTTYKMSNFKRHLLKHNDVRKHFCIICGLGFKRSDTLKQHLATHGANANTIMSQNGNTVNGIFPTCDVCQKICRSSSHLAEHKTMHSNVRTFKCDLCLSSFKTKSQQLKHQKIVHPDKPKSLYQCPHCPQLISSFHNLIRHMKNFHENSEMVVQPKEVLLTEEDDDEEEEPVIYTLDLTQDTQNNYTPLDANLHTYLINESGSLLVPTTNEYFSDQLTDLK